MPPLSISIPEDGPEASGELEDSLSPLPGPESGDGAGGSGPGLSLGTALKTTVGLQKAHRRSVFALKSAAGGGEIGPMPTFGGPPSMTSGPVGDLLDMIAKPESGGRYDSVYPGRRRPEILDMTLNELYADMRKRARRSGSSASGRYQYIRKNRLNY